MARLTYNPNTATVTFADVAVIAVANATIVTANSTTFHVRVSVTGTITGTVDAVYTGNFQTIAGVPVGGEFTGLRVDFNGQTLLQISDFSLPFSATQAPSFDNLVAQIMTGNDVVTGGALADILQGFAGADSMDGGIGIDFVQGNTGNDTLSGGDGADVIRGGRDDDSLFGGAGNDFLSGDRGNDTISGGAGADTFHVFAGSGVDRITDFNRAEGDKVLVFTGQTYTVTQSGADVLVDLGGGNQMILVGVQQGSLTDGWITTI